MRIRAGQFQPLFKVVAMLCPRCRRCLDFQCVQFAVALDDQINFFAAAGLPVIDLRLLPMLALEDSHVDL